MSDSNLVSKVGVNKSIIQCDDHLYDEVISIMVDALCGEYIYKGDSLADLIERHCPELYDICSEEGYHFLPSNDPSQMMETPPAFWFDILKIGLAN